MRQLFKYKNSKIHLSEGFRTASSLNGKSFLKKLLQMLRKVLFLLD